MNINIRKINCDEYKVLDGFLYEAILISEGIEAPPREIINSEIGKVIFVLWQRRGWKQKKNAKSYFTTL